LFAVRSPGTALFVRNFERVLTGISNSDDSFLNVVRVNLLTGTACSLVLIPLVPAAYSKSFICGDFAAVELRPTSEWFPLVLVINVVSQACTLLRFAPVCDSRLKMNSASSFCLTIFFYL
jgi:hypothetical protein